jgi:hypothetical protein
LDGLNVLIHYVAPQKNQEAVDMQAIYPPKSSSSLLSLRINATPTNGNFSTRFLRFSLFFNKQHFPFWDIRAIWPAENSKNRSEN